jgi:hypothetical protein
MSSFCSLNVSRWSGLSSKHGYASSMEDGRHVVRPLPQYHGNRQTLALGCHCNICGSAGGQDGRCPLSSSQACRDEYLHERAAELLELAFTRRERLRRG